MSGGLSGFGSQTDEFILQKSAMMTDKVTVACPAVSYVLGNCG